MNQVLAQAVHTAQSSTSSSSLGMRALELLLQGHREFEPLRSELTRELPPQAGASELAELLCRHLGWRGYAGHLSADVLARAHDAASALVFLTPKGWVISRAGRERRRSTLLGPAEPQQIEVNAAFLAEVLGDTETPAAVLTPGSGLGQIRQPAPAKRPWRRLRSFIGLEASDLSALVAYGVVLGALSLAVPVAVQVLVNSIAFTSLMQPIAVLSILLCGVLVFTGAIQVLQSYSAELLSRRVFVRVSESMVRRLANFDRVAGRPIDGAELSNRFFEIVTLQKSLSKLMIDGLGLCLQTLVGMVLLGFYHPFLLAFDLVLVLALGCVIALGLGAVRTSLKESSSKYRVAAWLQQIARQSWLFGRAGGSDMANAHADAMIRDYLSARRMHFAKLLRQSIGGVSMQVLAMVGLLGLGGWLVTRGELALGQLVAAELVVGAVGAGFAKSGRYFEACYDLMASLEKLGTIVDPGQRPRPLSMETETKAIAVRCSGLKIAEPGRGVLSIPDFDIPAGAAVVFERDIATARFAEVVAGELRPSAGRIRAAAEGHAQLGATRLREVSWLARPVDFAGVSIRQLLQIAQPNIGDPEIFDLLERIDLGEVVRGLDEGVATVLGPAGAPLADHELARLAVAQALAARPGLMILDSVLDHAALDERRMMQLLEDIESHNPACTLLVISNNPALRGRLRACSELIADA